MRVAGVGDTVRCAAAGTRCQPCPIILIHQLGSHLRCCRPALTRLAKHRPVNCARGIGRAALHHNTLPAADTGSHWDFAAGGEGQHGQSDLRALSKALAGHGLY